MQKWRTTVVALLTGVAMTAAAGCGGAATSGSTDKVPGVTEDTIRIGLLTDLTGPTVAIGAAIKLGAEAYVRTVNEAGGVNGRKIELVTRDHAFNPQKAVQQYREIRDEVLAMVTVEGEPLTAAVVPEADKDDMFFWPGTYTEEYAKTSHPPIATPYYYEALNALEFLAETMQAEGKKVSGFNLQSGIDVDYTRALQSGASFYGMQAGTTLAKPATETDYTGAVQTLAGDEPDFLLIGTAPRQAASFLATAHAQGLRVPVVLSSVGYSPDVLATEAGSVLRENTYVSSPWAQWDSPEPGQQALVRAVGPQQKPDVSVQTGWVMAQGVIELIKMADAAGDLSRAGIKKAMIGAKIDFGGVVPPLELKQENGAFVTSRATRIYKITDDGLELVRDLFVSKAATGSA